MKLVDIKLNKDNPRIIKDDKFKKLCKSIEKFPKMMELRPIIIDNNNIILAGNMRFQALKQLEYKEIPDNWIKQADKLTEEEKKEFIIKDNIGFGEWDWDILANEWDEKELEEWGLDLRIDFDDEQDTGEIQNEDETSDLIKLNVTCLPDDCISLIDDIKNLKSVISVEVNE